MNNGVFNIISRKDSGKGVARQLRVAGQVPAVIYYKGNSEMLTIAAKESTKLLREHKYETIYASLVSDSGVEKHAIIKDLQVHPVSGRLLHVDFLEVKGDEKVTINMTLNLCGSPACVKEGAVLKIGTHKLKVTGTPAVIPAVLDVDISGLEQDQSIYTDDLALPEGVVVATAYNTMVVLVMQARAEQDEPTEETVEE